MDRTLLRALQIQRILVGLFFVVAGLTKFFIIGVGRVELLCTQLGLPFAFFLAWFVPAIEILSGVAVIANYRLRHAAWPALLVAVGMASTIYWYGPGSLNGTPNWTMVLLYLVLASNLVVFALSAKR